MTRCKWVCTGFLLLNAALAGAADPYEPNDTPELATLLEVGAPPTSLTQIEPTASGEPADVDWFTWPSEAAAVYVVSVDSASSAGEGLVLALFDANRTLITSVTSPGKPHRIRIGIRGEVSPTLYARVSGLQRFYFPTYRLSVGPLSVLPDQNEPNSRWEQATPLLVDGLPPAGQNGVVSPIPGSGTTDEDWFRFPGTAGDVFDIEFRPEQGLPQLEVLRGDGTPVLYDTGWRYAQDSLTGQPVLRGVLKAPETTVYYLRIRGNSPLEVSHYAVLALRAFYEALPVPPGGLPIRPPILARPNGEMWGASVDASNTSVSRYDPASGSTAPLLPAISELVTDLDVLPNGELLVIAGNSVEEWHVEPPAFRRALAVDIVLRPIAAAVHDGRLYIADDYDGSLWRVAFRDVENPFAYQRIASGWDALNDLQVDRNGILYALTNSGPLATFDLLRIDPGSGNLRSIGGAVRLRWGQRIALDTAGGLYLWQKAGCCTERLVRLDTFTGAVLAVYTLEDRVFEFVSPFFDWSRPLLYLFAYRDFSSRALYAQPLHEVGVQSPVCLAPDSDADGLDDTREGFPPAAGQPNRYLPDSDGDGLGDGAEDLNANGHLDAGETDPRKADTDGDGVEDGIEIFFLATNPRNGDSPPPAARADTDRDRLPDSIDIVPTNPDGDNDGIEDGYEASQLGLGAAWDPTCYPALGDLSGDGFVSNLDALMVHGIFLGRTSPTAVRSAQGDATLDGQLSNTDALAIQARFQTTLSRLPVRAVPAP